MQPVGMSAPPSPSPSKPAHSNQKRRISQVPVSPNANAGRSTRPFTKSTIVDVNGVDDSEAGLEAALPIHRGRYGGEDALRCDSRASTESVTATNQSRSEEGNQKEITSPLDSWPREVVTRVGDRRIPSSSVMERPGQNDPPWTHDLGEASAGVGDPMVGALPDDDEGEDEDEGYVGDSKRSSFATSVASKVSRLSWEDGRGYPNYGRHEYGLPVDDREQERLAQQHQQLYLLLGKRYLLAPIGNSPERILDLATGTGQWAMAVADEFPSAVVVGVDVAAIQPTWVPTNCEFEIGDVEETWQRRLDSFDLIHMRHPLFVVRDWDTLLSQCIQHLKPGGWCELACTYLAPASDDGSMPDSSDFRLTCAKLVKASKDFGTPADCPLHFAEYLERAGFVNVTTQVFKIPSCPWPDDERQREIGILEQANLESGASALGLRLFKRVFGWTAAQTEVEMVGFRKAAANSQYRQHLPQWVLSCIDSTRTC